MHLVTAPDPFGNHNPSFEEIVAMNPEHLHYLEWCEEGEDIETLLKYASPIVEDYIRRLIEEDRFHYHCNALNDGVEKQSYHKVWVNSDLFFAWQTPVKTNVNAKKLFHCQAYVIKYHRDLFFDAVYKTKLDEVATLAYSQVRYEGIEKYADYVRKEYAWQEKYKQYYTAFEEHEADLVHDEKSNPAPPLEVWNQSAVNIVPETFYHRIGITEKTYHCMLFEKPFLMLNGQHSHKYLQIEDYKLYDEVFDYAFDNKDNIEDRVFDVVEQLKDLRNTNYNTLYKTLYETVLHNKKTYIRHLLEEPLPELFEYKDAVFTPEADKIMQIVRKAKKQAGALKT